MLTFCTVIHAADATAGLPATFEAAAAALGQLPRLFIEPDGSFVWRGAGPGGVEWQVDGNLVDQGSRLAYVELSGHCPSESLDCLLRALGWPEAPLAFQLPRQGGLLSESQFRQRAAEAGGAG